MFVIKKNILFIYLTIFVAIFICKMVNLNAHSYKQTQGYAQINPQNIADTKEIGKNRGFVVYPWDPISGDKVLPRQGSLAAMPTGTITLRACRGEFEPASFVICAMHSLSRVQISVSDLVNHTGQIIKSNAFDVRLVKCWYQAGKELWETTNRLLVPELLLKDDDLVKVDLNDKKNYIRVALGGHYQYIDISSPNGKIPSNALLEDSNSLLPFNLSAGSSKQVWLTVNVPSNAIAGDYKGKITVKSEENVLELDLRLEVLPFDLDPPLLKYSIYYRGMMTSALNKGINSEWKTPAQYLLELKNMRDHGISYPTIYQEYDPFFVRKCLELRQAVGFPNDNLYVLGLTTGNPSNSDDLRDLANSVKRWKNISNNYGYTNVYIYGMDEAAGEKLKSQRRAWQTVHDAGGMVFVACAKNAVNTVGDLLDLAVLHGRFDYEEVSKWHKYRKKVFSYSNPQVGIEDPLIYRNNYGFKLFAAKYDGAMLYAYQHGFGEIWNDFDYSAFRDHVFAYPTSNGVVDTVQWEGFRESVDDIRYLSTLMRLKSRDIDSIGTWLKEKMFLKESPKYIRNEIIKKIME
jgi:hypothetical protein